MNEILEFSKLQELEQKTDSIKKISQSAKSNFIKIGELLTEIRDKQLFLEKYSSFTEYLESEEFEFTRQYAYRLIDVAEKYKDVSLATELSISKLIELTYVPDREKREELLQAAVLDKLSVKELKAKRKDSPYDNEKKLFAETKRISSRENEKEVDYENKELKCIRQLKQCVAHLEAFRTALNDLKREVLYCLNFAIQYTENNEINLLKLGLEQDIESIRKILE